MARPSRRKIDRSAAAAKDQAARERPDICPLCERVIPNWARSSRHHLTPRLKGGTHQGTVHLHQICHNPIHARFSEAELAQRLNDVAALRADPELARFIAWVKTKPPGFHARTRSAKTRSGPRRKGKF